MKRRHFLSGLTASVGAVPLLKVLPGFSDRLERLAADLESTMTSEDLWRRVRREFQLNPGLIHLNCGTLGATPQLVTDAASNYATEIEGNPAVNTFGRGGAQMEDVRKHAAEFFGAQDDEVAFTRNTTEGMNAVATGLDLQPGDQVLTTNHEHGGGTTCWQYLRKHRGIEIVYLKMPRTLSSRQELVDLVQDHLTPRTKVCSFSHIDTITGVMMPLAEIAAITRPRGILLVCDGAQVPGMLAVDVKALEVDSYASSGHKWLLAPKGTGLLYVRKGAQDRIRPAFLHDGYGAYTASGGTRDIPSILGYGLTMDFHDTIGRDRIEERCRQLSVYLRRQLAELEELQPLTPEDPGLSGGILTCAVRRGDSGALVARMSRDHQILLKRAQSTFAYSEEEGLPSESYNAIRFSTHIFNDEADIDRTVDALREVLVGA